MESVYIVGTSGFAREVSDIVAANDMRPILVAANAEEAQRHEGPLEVVSEEALDDLTAFKLAIGIGDNAVRRRVAEKFEGRADFVNLIHPGASFGIGQRELVRAKRGVIVCAGVRFTNSIAVGDFSIFNLNATIGHDVVVESFVNIAPGANISGYVHLREGVWVGTGAAINQGNAEAPLEVGANTVIGSGSVVVKSCEPDCTYVGIPARPR